MRGFHAGVLTLSVIATSAFAACGNTDDGVVCGKGTVREGDVCVASATDGDAGGPATTTDSGPAAAVLSFDGVRAVAPSSPTSLFVTWNAATSTGTPSADITYAVYVVAGGAIDYTKPTATTPPGATSFLATRLDPATTYTVAVRAVTHDGAVDGNTNVKTGKPAADATPPTFDGAKSATASGPGKVTLAWDAAADDLTPPEALVYYVYATPSSGTLDLTVPTLVSAPGATSIDVSGLYQTGLTYNFLVRARDAADNLDTGTHTQSALPGADTTAPAFTGCKSAAGDSAGSVIVAWEPAVDDTTPADVIAYDVYATSIDGEFDFGHPHVTAVKSNSVRVTGLASNTVWHFVCRARDYVGNHDVNQIERSARTLIDDVPPTFDGITSAATVVDGLARTVTFGWPAATDDRTQADQIVYDVFEGTKSGGEAFSGPPRASSAPGATTMTVTDLTPDTKLFWVVRARDLGGNHDLNTVEASGTINVSFSRQVQPILSHDCAVSGCHVPGNPMANLILAPGFAYSYLVGHAATELPTSLRVKPSDSTNSFFYQKISLNPPPVGWTMPAPATGSVLTSQEKDVIRRWIDQGAVDN